MKLQAYNKFFPEGCYSNLPNFQWYLVQSKEAIENAYISPKTESKHQAT